MNRLTAILLAAALVIGAVFVRAKIKTHKAESSATLRLTCSTALEATCTALAEKDKRIIVTVDPAGSTADRLAKAGDPGFDGWLTLGPWGQIATAADPSTATLTTTALGRGGKVGLAVKPDRLAALRQLCGTPAVGWDCVQSATAKAHWSTIPGGSARWGDVTVGVPDPSSDDVGLAALGNAAVAHLKRADISSTADFPDFQSWLGPIADSAKIFDDPLGVLAVRPAELDMAVTVDAVGAPYLASVANTNKPMLIYPSPVATAEINLGTTKTTNGERLRALFTSGVGKQVLVASGWSPGRQANEPDAGVLDALRTLWKRTHS